MIFTRSAVPVEPSSQGWTPPGASDPAQPPAPSSPQPAPAAYPYPTPVGVQPGTPYPPYGAVPRRPGTNGFAIGSLVTGIVCCLPPLGLVLGLVALAQIRKRGDEGRGLAIAGTALSVISTILMAVAFATGTAGEAWDGFRQAARDRAAADSTFDMRTGQCFDTPGRGLKDEEEAASVRIVDCDRPHEGEVTGTFPLDGFDEWPGEKTVETEAERRCEDINSAYTLDWWAVPGTAEPYYYMPTRHSWRFGDRSVTCALASRGPKLVSSVRSDRTTLDPAQLAYLEGEMAVDAVWWEEPEDLFEDDPEANRAWAERMARTLGAEARDLRAGPWPAAARTHALTRAKEYDTARRHFGRAAVAQDEESFWDATSEADDAFRQETEIAVRSALGLATDPPEEADDAGEGEPLPSDDTTV
ncbi:DUF4190 domain-containing protein [Streptomyces sp. WMMC940]|uniref:DUF4190 domain-containing protein n=1 Tax=Streptomyces sp. WMMC940 TaxID=3015153 RepID=UPI0022B66A6C|nr:DUF4190 domain-containing protein [Streptomyces sp. WMMC940]MCZ7458191.1 DUF4190 domain-containing protein [Streptomyces sp. WMMC940]